MVIGVCVCVCVCVCERGGGRGTESNDCVNNLYSRIVNVLQECI